jgi:excisionase family DNA binding protein
MTSPPRLSLRPSEAAQALGVSERTLRQMMRDEGLPYCRVGGAVLIPVRELEAWLAARLAESETGRVAGHVGKILEGLKDA